MTYQMPTRSARQEKLGDVRVAWAQESPREAPSCSSANSNQYESNEPSDVVAEAISEHFRRNGVNQPRTSEHWDVPQSRVLQPKQSLPEAGDYQTREEDKRGCDELQCDNNPDDIRDSVAVERGRIQRDIICVNAPAAQDNFRNEGKTRRQRSGRAKQSLDDLNSKLRNAGKIQRWWRENTSRASNTSSLTMPPTTFGEARTSPGSEHERTEKKTDHVIEKEETSTPRRKHARKKQDWSKVIVHEIARFQETDLNRTDVSLLR